MSATEPGSVTVEKKPSTAFSQDADVGVKWKTHLGWFAHRVEQSDEFLMAMAHHATPSHRAVQDIEGEQGGGAVTLLIVGRSLAFARLPGQARLDLAFLVEVEGHHLASGLT